MRPEPKRAVGILGFFLLREWEIPHSLMPEGNLLLIRLPAPPTGQEKGLLSSSTNFPQIDTRFRYAVAQR